jgi:hypothetical protein
MLDLGSDHLPSAPTFTESMCDSQKSLRAVRTCGVIGVEKGVPSDIDPFCVVELDCAVELEAPVSMLMLGYRYDEKSSCPYGTVLECIGAKSPID